MQLKAAVISQFSRDDLRVVVDDLGLVGVDRRSVESMRSALSRSRTGRTVLCR